MTIRMLRENSYNLRNGNMLWECVHNDLTRYGLELNPKTGNMIIFVRGLITIMHKKVSVKELLEDEEINRVVRSAYSDEVFQKITEICERIND